MSSLLNQYPGIARGLLLGLGAAVPIGPVNVEIARRVFRSGFFAGAALGLGAVTIDMTYALASTFSWTRILDQPAFLVPISIAGIAFLGYIAVLSLRAGYRAWHSDPLSEAALQSPSRPAGSAYLTGLLMTLFNPMTLLFWFAVLPATGADLPAGDQVPSPTLQIPNAETHDLPMMMMTGIFIATAAWVFTFSSLLAWASAHAGGNHPGRRKKWLAAADVLGGTTLLAFGVISALRLFRSVR